MIVLFVVLHLAFPPRSLEDIDSINLALGVRDFDGARHQPHPPGYPVLVAAARMVSPLVPGELRALSVLSAVGRGLALLSMWRLFPLLTKTTGLVSAAEPFRRAAIRRRSWRLGGPVWFVANPPRSHLALVGISRPLQRYRWPFDARLVLGGIRPGEMDWYRIDGPDWYLGEGWALTPETAGVAREDHRGPGGPGEGGATGRVR